MWLKKLAVIDVKPYRRFYRHPRSAFAGAGNGAICVVTTLATSLIGAVHIEQVAELQPFTPWDKLLMRATIIGAHATRYRAQSAASLSYDPTREIVLNGQVPTGVVFQSLM